MFQTDIIRWMQSFDAPTVRLFFQGISLLGEREFTTLLVVVLIFGVDHRRGFVITQVVLWTTIVTSILKDAVALPRPVDVDLLVAHLGRGDLVPHAFIDRGAHGFWAPLPPDVVAYYRTLHTLSYGFPSGHCSSSLAGWGSTALLFRRPWLFWTAGILALMMPLSRMYLGKHFLADVLGGMLLGLLALVVFFLAQKRFNLIAPELPRAATRRAFPSLASTLFLILLPLAGMALPGETRHISSTLLGLNLGYLVTGGMRSMGRITTMGRRAAMIGAALLAYAAATIALRWLLFPFRASQPDLTAAVQELITAVLVIVVPALLSMKLYRDSLLANHR